MMGLTRVLPALTLILAVSACSATYRNHGFAPSDEELSEIVVGVDTRDSVEETVGKPGTSGVLADTAWYYTSHQVRNWAYRAPEEIDRQVVAISFGPSGVVQNIERFGLADGQVVTLSRRVTETSIREFGLVQQLFRNFGRINIGDALGG